jgi:hypothetical protein
MVPNQPADETTRFEEDLVVEQSYLTVARRLRQLGQPILGLWPVPVAMAFDELPRHLAKALASLGFAVGLVAPPACWCDDVSEGQLRVSSLGESVDSLTPVWPGGPAPAAAIEQTLALIHDRYACVLLDLAGMDVADAHEVALLPGVAIVFLVAQGRINQFALGRLRRRIPAERLLGAVLVESQRRGAIA